MSNRFASLADGERTMKESGKSKGEDRERRAGEGAGTESKNKSGHVWRRKKREKARSAAKTGETSQGAQVTDVDRRSVSVYDLVTMSYEEKSGSETVRRRTAELVPTPRPPPPAVVQPTRTPTATPMPVASHIGLPIDSAKDLQTQADCFSWRPPPPIMPADDTLAALS
jgi:hypothetical protein